MLCHVFFSVFLVGCGQLRAIYKLFLQLGSSLTTLPSSDLRYRAPDLRQDAKLVDFLKHTVQWRAENMVNNWVCFGQKNDRKTCRTHRDEQGNMMKLIRKTW